MGIKTRLFSIALLLALIASLSGCAAPPVVIDGEENAKAVYDMFRQYGGTLANVTDDELRVYVTMENADGIWNLSNKIEERDGKYIVTKKCYENRKYDSEKGTWGKIGSYIAPALVSETNGAVD